MTGRGQDGGWKWGEGPSENMVNCY
jgi:hypothetical protein